MSGPNSGILPAISCRTSRHVQPGRCSRSSARCVWYGICELMKCITLLAPGQRANPTRANHTGTDAHEPSCRRWLVNSIVFQQNDAAHAHLFTFPAMGRCRGVAVLVHDQTARRARGILRHHVAVPFIAEHDGVVAWTRSAAGRAGTAVCVQFPNVPAPDSGRCKWAGGSAMAS